MNRLTVGQTAALSVGDTVADCQVVARTGGEAVLVPHEPKIAARLPAAGDGASLVFKHGDRLVMLRGAMYRGTSDDDLRFAAGSLLHGRESSRRGAPPQARRLRRVGSTRAACRRKRPLGRQHRLKAPSGAARAEVVPPELLGQLLVAVDDPVAPLDP